jgi:ubiquinone/menaquinone biosynthesis C-methylase UbiE
MPGADTFLSSADAYERHVGRYSTQLATAMIDFAGVERGMRALDVGCGTGALTAVLADRLGPERVTGADPSRAFIDACRARLHGECSPPARNCRLAMARLTSCFRSSS